MDTPERGPTVLLETWELGDVLAIVDRPEDFPVQERSWWHVGVGQAGLGGSAGALPAAAGVAAIVPPLTVAVVPLAVLGLTLNRHRLPARQPHVALMALADARKLVGQELLFFPEGGPTVGQVYGRHPLRVRDYLPYASYHRILLHEKCIEAARYLLSLGARDVEITCDQSKGKDAKGGEGVVAPNVDDISLKMGFGRDDKGRLAIRITGAGKRSEVPADLVWPGRDTMFKLALDAASAGAETFHFGLKTEHSGSVNARAAVKLEKELGLDLGGEYKRWEDLSFTVDATFGQRQQ